MKYVTEEMRPQDEWFKRAKEIKSIGEFSAFANGSTAITNVDCV